MRNEAGQRLIEFCQENALVVANTLFQQHKRRLYTWTSPDVNTEIRLIIFFAAKDGEALYSQQKQTRSWLWLRSWTPYCQIQTYTEEAEVEQFYEDLQDLLELTPKKDVLFIIGDWNAKVGNQETPGVTGKFGQGIRNEAGQRLIDFAKRMHWS